jgi:GntR family transcriptional regulator/MocR family aminotransferase
VHAPADRIVVCSGFAQGLALVCAAVGAGRFATEAFGHASHRAILAEGREVSALTVDDEGACVDELARERAVLLTPAHQFPLGAPLAAHRRVAVAEWARERGGVVVEDDYDGEFRYDRQPLGALQALAPERVVYAGTASKSLAPALRLGWIVVPEHLLEPVLAARTRTDGPGAIDQLALADFIASSAYDRQVRRMRLVYRRRRDALVRALGRDRVRGIDAGLQLVVDVPDEGEAVANAGARGVAVEGLAAYRLGAQAHAPALVVGYGTPPEHAFTTAVARLRAALS